MLCAVLERHVEFLAQREGELLAKARRTPDDDVGAVVEAIVRPAAELAASGWRGRACLLIVAELAGEDPARLSPELESVLARTGGHEVYALLAARMPAVPPRDPRRALQPHHLVHPPRRRRPGTGQGAQGPPVPRAQLDDEAFVENLVAMVAAAVSAVAVARLDVSRGGQYARARLSRIRGEPCRTSVVNAARARSRAGRRRRSVSCPPGPTSVGPPPAAPPRSASPPRPSTSPSSPTSTTRSRRTRSRASSTARRPA